MTTEISPEAASRREQARDDHGRFGPSTAPEADPGTVDLDGAGPATSVGDHHGAELASLAKVEQTIAAQLSRVRTTTMQHQIADWLHEAETSGSVDQDAKALVLLRHDDEVNEYGSTDLSAGYVLDGDGQAVDDEGDLPELTIQLHADDSGPDLYGDGWVDENDQVDLDRVREWSTSHLSHQNGFRARFDAAANLRRDTELELAGAIREQVREHYPTARYVHMAPDGGPTLTLSRITDADGNTLHEMYGEAGEGVPETFDDQVDETVRGMTADAIGAPPYSWPEMCAEELVFDDYNNVDAEARLDLDRPPRMARDA